MIKHKTFIKNNSAFTLIELIIAASVGISVLGLFGVLARQNNEQSRKSRIYLRSQMEHYAFKQLLASIPGKELTSIFCSYPHPYMDYDPVAQKCNPGRRKDSTPYPAPSEAELKDWQNLSIVIFQYANNHVENRHRTPLSKTGYDAVVTALETAKCMGCHDGKATSFNAKLNRDFSNFEDMTKEPALISRDMLVSPLGKRLLRTSMPLFPSLMMGVNDTTGAVEEVTHDLTLSTGFDETYCEPANKNIVHKDGVNSWELFCPTKCDASNNNCAGVCPSGQFPDLTSCIYYCSTVNTDTCSNDVAACLNWRRSLICLTPKVTCSNTASLTCPAGTLLQANSCQLNQSHPKCGDGATVWKCADPNNPIKYQAGVIQYLLSTTVRRPATLENQAVTKTLVTEGTLP